MAGSRMDVGWPPQGPDGAPRHVFVHDELRYAQGASQRDIELDGFINFHWLASSEHHGRRKVMLDAGINSPAEVVAVDGSRRAVVAIRSSPWKAGHETNPWHDEFDLDHGHVRYFGDHKPTTVGLPGSTKGNRILLEAAQLHAGTTHHERMFAPPLLLFRAITVHRAGRALVKGHVEFCGAAIIERLEHVVQRDPESGKSFPNIVLDLAVIGPARGAPYPENRAGINDDDAAPIRQPWSVSVRRGRVRNQV